MDEANKSPDAASDFFLINKSFFLKALAQSKPAKWEKWRVWSRGWTHERLCSRSLAEAQNDIMVKMKGKWSTVSVINPSSDTSCSALLLLSGSISINTNLLSLFHTHTNTLGKLLIAWGSRVSAQLGTRLRTSQGDPRSSPPRPRVLTASVSPCHQGSLLETTSLPSMGRLFKQCQACAVAQLAAQKTRWRFAGLIVLWVLLWVPSRCHSQQGTVEGWVQHDAHT